ncbi:hypothetical protein [Paenibacillus macerans]|nr:hypothetical protein [Paenibacillus macerans]
MGSALKSALGSLLLERCTVVGWNDQSFRWKGQPLAGTTHRLPLK